jgi:predicted transcriptional regulator
MRIGITDGITKDMKRAISVDDSLMAQADEAARDLGLTRSGLIAEALRTYLRQRERSRITQQLNEAYCDAGGSPDEGLVKKLRTKLPVSDRW